MPLAFALISWLAFGETFENVNVAAKMGLWELSAWVSKQAGKNKVMHSSGLDFGIQP